jgi:hypothetical protein
MVNKIFTTYSSKGELSQVKSRATDTGLSITVWAVEEFEVGLQIMQSVGINSFMKEAWANL